MPFSQVTKPATVLVVNKQLVCPRTRTILPDPARGAILYQPTDPDSPRLSNRSPAAWL